MLPDVNAVREPAYAKRQHSDVSEEGPIGRGLVSGYASGGAIKVLDARWLIWAIARDAFRRTTSPYRAHINHYVPSITTKNTKEGDYMVLVRGGLKVRPHVQRFADDCSKATGADNFGTYNGHSPSFDLALDIFTPTNSRVLGDAICDFAMKHQKAYGVDYIIYRQRIWNPEVASYWREMGDRGGITQNHIDHVHISFEPSAPGPSPTNPAPTKKENDSMFTYSTAPSVDQGSIWLVINGTAFRLHRPDDAQRINDKGVTNFGQMSESFHNLFEHRG